MSKYISETITLEDIENWQPGSRILICSQTGSGKSQFIKENLYNYCNSRGLRILLLTNRRILRKQNLKDLIGRSDTIEAVNYQALESQFIEGNILENLFKPFAFIIYDEAHYFFSDSLFNRNTDILLDPIINTPIDKIFIFLTATPQSLLLFQPDFAPIYNIPKDYSYIEEIYFYNKQPTINQIIQQIPLHEKILYFSSEAVDAYELSLQNTNAKFLCSTSNHSFSKKRSKEAAKSIEDNQWFDCHLLCVTKVLDNGINLVDDSLKHIVIDMLDPLSLIQCLGRKRIANGEKINLYIRNYYSGMVFTEIHKTENTLALVKDLKQLGKEEFQTKYKRKSLDALIQTDMSINQAKYIYLKNYYRNLISMINDEDGDGYKKVICNYLQFPFSKTKQAELYFEKKTLIPELENLKEKKMFREDIDEFKIFFFNNIFNPKKTDYRKRGIISINAILQEDELDYEIISSKETKGENCNKHYWMIVPSNLKRTES